MGKSTQPLPDQETLPVDEPAPPTPFNALLYLNETNGFIELADLPGFDLDPERPVTVLGLMTEIGTALAEEPPQGFMWDGPLGVHGDDFENASADNLVRGLYFSHAESVKRAGVITIGRYEPTLRAPGVRGTYEGVSVEGDEFKLVARSAPDIAKHADATVRAANEKRPPEEKLDDETVNNRAGRASAHAMISRRESLLEYDVELKAGRRALAMINGEAKLEGGLQLPLLEMDLYRRISAMALGSTTSVAARQLGYGTTMREGIMRAQASRTSRGEPESIINELKNYTRLAGHHIDAKRGKLYQSLSVCREVFREYYPYLKTKEAPESASS